MESVKRPSSSNSRKKDKTGRVVFSNSSQSSTPKALLYALEQFLSIMPNIRVIAQTVQIDVLLKYFPLFLDGQEPVCKLLPDLSSLGEKEPEENKLTKVTDLSAGVRIE